MLLRLKQITMFVILLSGAVAQARSGSSFERLFQNQNISYSLNEEVRRSSVFELLGTTAENCVDADGNQIACSWPNFPRVWFEKIEGKNQQTKIAVTAEMEVKIPGIFEAAAGVEVVPFNYTYSTEISLQVIGTRSVKDASAPPVDHSPAQGATLDALFKMNFDNPNSPKRFFNATAQSPMVGFCTYRMALRKEFSVTTGGRTKVTFPGGVFNASGGLSAAQANTRYEQEGILLQSQFFQIRPDVPVDDYLGVKCKQQFLPTARAFVQKAFDQTVLTTLGQWSGGAQCQMSGEQTETGDEHCMAWFEGTIHPTTKHSTLPRCEVNKKGVGLCRLRMKENMPCSMYVDRNGGFSDKFRMYSEATTILPGTSGTCDRGYKCSMDANPWMIGSMVIWPGRASCKPE